MAKLNDGRIGGGAARRSIWRKPVLMRRSASGRITPFGIMVKAGMNRGCKIRILFLVDCPNRVNAELQTWTA